MLYKEEKIYNDIVVSSRFLARMDATGGTHHNPEAQAQRRGQENTAIRNFEIPVTRNQAHQRIHTDDGGAGDAG